MNKPRFGYEKRFAFLLVLSLLSMSGISLARERKHDAKLLIQKKDGELIKDELIAVKSESLLILGTTDISIGYGEVRSIKIIKKSKVGKGLLFGFLAGGSGGALMGLARSNGYFSRAGMALFGGIVVSVIGMAVGGVAGGLSEIDETVQITGRDDQAKKTRIQKNLRPLARVVEEIP